MIKTKVDYNKDAEYGGMKVPIGHYSDSMHHYSEFHQKGKGGMNVDYWGKGTIQTQHDSSQQHSIYKDGIYNGMALSEGFLHEYYSQVSQTH